MINLVLYRKYRPQLFKDVVGQENIVKTLQNAILNGNLSHAYLFSGPRGCGKTTLARIVAKAANCTQRKQDLAEPCNKCDSCLEISQGKAIDLVEIDAASNRGIDEIRELKEGIRFRPAKSKYKVFIIDEAHQLTKEAANALLKTLEEPPDYAIFILATTESNKMIPTILSRCQKFDFKKMTLQETIGRLSKILDEEKIKYEKEALELIALYSGGALRDAESLLDEAVSFVGQDGKIEKKEIMMILGAPDASLVFEFLELIKDKKAKEAIELINKIYFENVDLKEFIKLSIQLLREVLFLKVGAETESPLILSLSQENKNELKTLSGNFEEGSLKNVIELLFTAENKMRYSQIPQLPLELAIIEICHKKG